jgi:ABC-type Fe3+ transport system permease subunit
MDTPAIIVKIVGLVLFIFTVRSVYKHFRGKARKHTAAQSSQPQAQQPQHSKAEHVLNTFLLYAWFIFMTALSLGMLVNN